MKIKKGYNLRSVAGEKIVIPLADESRKNQGIFKLNDEGGELFKLFQNGAEIADGVKLLCSKYCVNEKDAETDVEDFVEVLRKFEMLED